MKRSNRRTFRLKQMLTRRFIGCAVVIAFHSAAMAGTLNFFNPYQWTTAACVGSNCTWTAPSPFGAVTAFSNMGWYPVGGSVPTGFTPPLTNEFYASVVGDSVVMTLPTGLNWGTAGGELILGQIHNFYEYNLSATDSSGNPINVNDWTYLGEDLTPEGSHPDPVSATSTCTFGGHVPDGSACPGTSSSEDFYVYDTSACGGSIPICAGTSQGGVVALGNLPSTVRTITLTQESSNLGLFETGDLDVIYFNVGQAPVPEPSSALLLGPVVVGMLLLRRRRPSGRVA